MEHFISKVRITLLIKSRKEDCNVDKSSVRLALDGSRLGREASCPTRCIIVLMPRITSLT